MTLPHLRFSLFDAQHDLVDHAIFTREGGVSKEPFESLNISYSGGDNPESVAENRARCAGTLGLTTAQLITAGLVHGTAVAVVATHFDEVQRDGTRILLDVDALITDQQATGLMISAADCIQVLFLDPQRKAIGIAHAGWRGMVGGVLDATVKRMCQSYQSDPATILVGIGPGLGPCCARFSDPERELPAHFQRYVQNQHLDLWTAARHQLQDAGVLAGHIEHHAICTVCNRDRFFSHRGDRGRTGRFAAIIALRA